MAVKEGITKGRDPIAIIYTLVHYVVKDFIMNLPFVR